MCVCVCVCVCSESCGFSQPVADQTCLKLANNHSFSLEQELQGSVVAAV